MQTFGILFHGRAIDGFVSVMSDTWNCCCSYLTNVDIGGRQHTDVSDNAASPNVAAPGVPLDSIMIYPSTENSVTAAWAAHTIKECTEPRIWQ